MKVLNDIPNRCAGMFINFDEKFPNLPIARPLFYFILLMPAHLFGPALIFGTLEPVCCKKLVWGIGES